MIEFGLNYDKSKFEYISASKGGFKSKFSYVNMSSGEADTESVTLTFKAIATGNTSFTISNLKVATASQHSTSYPVSNSSVSVTAKVKETPSKPSTNNKPSTNTSTNKNNNKNNTNKKDENKVEEPVVEEPVVIEPAPDELIKIEQDGVKTLRDEATSIMVKALPVAFEDGTVLGVKSIRDGHENYATLNDALKNIEGIKTYYTLNLSKDNTVIQPNGYVTIFLPIPEGYDKERLEVYQISEDGTYELLKGEIQGSYYTFTTNHPSSYALVEKPEEKIEEKKAWHQEIMEKAQDMINNVNVLHITIIVLLCIILIETIVIIRLSQKRAKRSK
ncbi:MAG: hypothetical protein HFJ27_00295 [Clostridia bacterium]|nr:hypothetical protein [Clostridia bacterium]